MLVGRQGVDESASNGGRSALVAVKSCRIERSNDGVDGSHEWRADDTVDREMESEEERMFVVTVINPIGVWSLVNTPSLFLSSPMVSTLPAAGNTYHIF